MHNGTFSSKEDLMSTLFFVITCVLENDAVAVALEVTFDRPSHNSTVLKGMYI